MDPITLIVTALVAGAALGAQDTVSAGKYTVDVRGAQGVQIGDRNRQNNVFNPRRAAKAPEMIATTFSASG
jgi:hypothetical protein